MSARAYARVLVALLAGGVLLTSTAQAQTTWYVDDDAPNDPGPGDPSVSDPLEDGSAEHPFDAIQEGIDTAVDGDTVLALDGTYTGDGNRDMDYAGKQITVRSENGPENCIIDCQGAGRGFYFHSGETEVTVVDGFTVRNGDVEDESFGGGIFCSGASPTITNCTISENRARSPWARGGGIYCENSSPTITHSTIRDNTVQWQGGLDDSMLWGGGIYSSGGSPTISHCAIYGNRLSAYTEYGEGVAYGGGICCAGGELTLLGCKISGNSAWSNRDSRGGGIYFAGAGLSVHVSTISGNSVSGVYYALGGGLRSESADAAASNCILWGNTPDEISGTAAVTYSNVQGGWPGEGNIDADPLFVDPDGPDDDPSTWEDNDYHLDSGSPCIDAGNNAAVPAGILTDLDGNPRFVDDPATADTGYGTPPIVDMGAYEYQYFCFGDIYPDGEIDLVDLAILLSNYGQSAMAYADGDLDGDSDVDLADLAALLAVYGTTCE